MERRLDVLVLGPMGEDDRGPASTLPIQDAIENLLQEDALRDLLNTHNIQEHTVHVPAGQNESEIVANILGLLDTADLVVFNLTPKQENPDRANVFYELGLVHALGIPAMLVVQEDTVVPFYAQSTQQYRVREFSVEALTDALRSPIRSFLDFENEESTTTFVNDRVTQFYRLPIVDISAAVGLATGYYFNFLSRLITEGGFLAEYPGTIRAVVYVRPSSIQSTYEADQERLRAALEGEGLQLETRKLDPPKSDEKGPIWFDHVDGIVLDVPRTIYPLRRSPRLLSFLERYQHRGLSFRRERSRNPETSFSSRRPPK
jgi:nucleoside 2-deoxyribosyltransferase